MATLNDAITAVVNKAESLTSTATANDLIYLAKSLQAVSDDKAPGQAAAQTIINRAEALSAEATDEQLVSLAKAVEAVAGNATLAGIVGEGDTQLTRVTTEGDTQDDRVLEEGNTQHQRVVDQGDTQVNRVATTMESTIAAGDFTRYDLALVSSIDTLDLATANEFTIDASTARTLTFANTPGAGRAMTVVLTISGASAITWPVGVRWSGGTAPTLGTTWTIVVLSWDGANWNGTLGASA